MFDGDLLEFSRSIWVQNNLNDFPLSCPQSTKKVKKTYEGGRTLERRQTSSEQWRHAEVTSFAWEDDANVTLTSSRQLRRSHVMTSWGFTSNNEYARSLFAQVRIEAMTSASWRHKRGQANTTAARCNLIKISISSNFYTPWDKKAGNDFVFNGKS